MSRMPVLLLSFMVGAAGMAANLWTIYVTLECIWLLLLGYLQLMQRQSGNIVSYAACNMAVSAVLLLGVVSHLYVMVLLALLLKLGMIPASGLYILAIHNATFP